MPHGAELSWGGGPEEATEEVDGAQPATTSTVAAPLYLCVHGACTWSEGTCVKYSLRSTKGEKKRKTSSDLCEDLEREGNKGSISGNCERFNPVYWVGAIVPNPLKCLAVRTKVTICISFFRKRGTLWTRRQ